MKQLLMKSDFTVSELAAEADCPPSHASRAIKQWVSEGLVEIVAFRNSCKHMAAYTWCGDDDLETAAIAAAEFLRFVWDHDAQALAKRLFNALGREYIHPHDEKNRS